MIYFLSDLTLIIQRETLFQVITIPRTFTPSGLLPFLKAKEIILQSFCAPDNQVCIRTSDACGRVLAAPVYSNRTNPPLLLSGPDGIAVKSEETNRAEEEKGIEVHAIRVNTGMPVPEGFDAVIPIEEVELREEQRYRIHTRVVPCWDRVSRETSRLPASTPRLRLRRTKQDGWMGERHRIVRQSRLKTEKRPGPCQPPPPWQPASYEASVWWRRPALS